MTDTAAETEPSDAKPRVSTTGPQAGQGSAAVDADKAPLGVPPPVDTTAAEAGAGDPSRDPDKKRADGEAEAPAPEPDGDEGTDDELGQLIAALSAKIEELNAKIDALDSTATVQETEPMPPTTPPSDAGERKPKPYVAGAQRSAPAATKALAAVQAEVSKLSERLSRIENARRASAQAQLGSQPASTVAAETGAGGEDDNHVFRGVLTRGLHMPMRLGDAVRRSKMREP